MSQKSIAIEPAGSRQLAADDPSVEPSTRYAVGDLAATLGTLVKAKILNMSLTGAGIQTSQYLEIRRTYPFRFDGPSGVLSLRATVIWSRLVKTVSIGQAEVLPMFMTGLAFADLAASQRKDLAVLLAGCSPILRPGPDSRRRSRGSGSPRAGAAP